MRKHLGLFIITSLFALVVSGCNGSDKKEKLSFKESEYQIHSGDRITVEQKYNGVIYSFAGAVPLETTLNEKTGEISFTKNTPNYSQVILTAAYKELQSDQAIVTLLQNEVKTELSFHTPIKNIVDGDYILVSSSTNKAITYSLENPVKGVSIDSMNGRVHYNNAAIDGSSFTVIASSASSVIKETYTVVTNHLAISLTKTETHEKNSNVPATFVLDFSNTPTGTEEKVIGLMNEFKLANDNEYTYDKTLHTLVVNPSFLETFKDGENKLKIITERNIITVDLVMVTKYIKNAHDLQSINESREALSGYYILENDIDLTDYLAYGGEGYNDARGWNQIGIYHDLENDPTRDSFNGTFDGNGHIISGYFEERADDLAHNEGLFGYTTNQALIKNVGFVGDVDHKTTGRNLIGGFVGFNEGTIKNCWTNVNISNKHEDKIFNSVGAFAGGNTGVIDSCFAIGTPEGDNLVGAFVGKNYGDISNCYAINAESSVPFCGTQVTGSHVDCQIFSSLGEMKAFDFSSRYDSDVWTFNPGELPSLNHLIEIDFANGIEIANKENEIDKGSNLSLEVIIHPNDLHDAYIDSVQYSIVPSEGSGITNTGKIYNTSGALVDEFTALAVLETPYGKYSAAKTFKVLTPVSSITFVDDLPNYVEPGKQYALHVNIEPSNAPQDVTWEILDGEDDSHRVTHPGRFCFLRGNILTIEETMMNFRTKDANRTFEVKATTRDGKSVTKELRVKKISYLGDTYCDSLESDHITQNVLTYYADTTESTVNFVLPSTAVFSGMQVFRYSSRIYDFTRSGHTIKIPMKYIKEVPNRQLSFTFRCGDGDSQVIYRGYACYIDHNRYTISDVPSQYIALSSAQDFYDHFRMTLEDTDTSKYVNYDKTFVLTDDIDFNNASSLVSIGYQSSSHNADNPFKGTIYGFGHTIKNAKFQYSERYYYVGPTIGERDPNKDRVGFFGYFQGKIYDVVFENIISDARNYGGCFAGSILSGGYLENVTFHNCKVTGANETDYTIYDEKHPDWTIYVGRVAASSAGTFVAVTYNGTSVGLVGR